ncbi:hypothetical protein C1645_882612 [Glomus cerebriforme]|uniref:Uncharacterized protein n=1 Tax=Glomus cerebriforme TaxID=658196 RepID=A0A397S0X2_9GLOM|nr:hypothetical protein C1645_882612 [Glomus cerebriforme]
MKYILPENNQIIHCISNEQSSMLPDMFLKEFQEVDNISLIHHGNWTHFHRIFHNENYIETRSVIILKTVHSQRYNNAIDLETISWSNVSAVCKNIFDYINNIIRSGQYELNLLLHGSKDGLNLKISFQNTIYGGSCHDNRKKGVSLIVASLSMGVP